MNSRRNFNYANLARIIENLNLNLGRLRGEKRRCMEYAILVADQLRIAHQDNEENEEFEEIQGNQVNQNNEENQEIQDIQGNQDNEENQENQANEEIEENEIQGNQDNEENEENEENENNEDNEDNENNEDNEDYEENEENEELLPRTYSFFVPNYQANELVRMDSFNLGQNPSEFDIVRVFGLRKN